MNKIDFINNSVCDTLEYKTNHVSIVGANGSGKTALFRAIQGRNGECQVIQALKNLTIYQNQFRSLDDNLLENQQISQQFVDGKGSPIHGFSQHSNIIQSDFNVSMELIFREFTNFSLQDYRNGGTYNSSISKTKLDSVFKIWTNIFNGKKIDVQDNQIKANSNNTNDWYSIDNLSDGERSVLYILIKIALAKENSFILIDEPETFLNPALLNLLFDECEKFRTDCKFIYFSHDLDFVSTRCNNTKYWIKSYNYPETWEIEELKDDKIPEEVLLKIIGTKIEKILFVESESTKDTRLYQKVYPDFKVWGVGSCENVINYTKAFNTGTEKFNKQYFGLIDRDLKSESEITQLKLNKVFCLPVALYENLFLRSEIIKFVFQHEGSQDIDNKLDLLSGELTKFVTKDHFIHAFTKDKVKQYFNQNIDDLANQHAFNPDFQIISAELELLKTQSSDDILMKFNQKDTKGLTTQLGYKFTEWVEKVLNLFNTRKEEELRNLFKSIIGMIK